MSGPTTLHSFGPSTMRTSSGIELLARSVEDPDGTVVMVHGTLDRGGSFSRLARRLDGLDAVTFDRRGYQSSRHVGGAISLSDHIEDLGEIVETLDGRGPITLVGHSFGGVIAIAATIAMPDAVQAVVAYEPPMPWLWDVPPHAGAVLGDDPAEEVERFFRRMVSDQAWERLSDAERQSRVDDGAGLMSDLRIIRTETPFTLDAVARLVPPLAICVGATSEGHRAVAERVVAAVPGATLATIPGAPHGAHLSHPGPLADLVASHAARRKDRR